MAVYVDGFVLPVLRDKLDAYKKMARLAGKIWRVGLMGAGSTPQTLLQLLGAFEGALEANGGTVRQGAGVAAAVAALKQVPVPA